MSIKFDSFLKLDYVQSNGKSTCSLVDNTDHDYGVCCCSECYVSVTVYGSGRFFIRRKRLHSQFFCTASTTRLPPLSLTKVGRDFAWLSFHKRILLSSLLRLRCVNVYGNCSRIRWQSQECIHNDFLFWFDPDRPTCNLSWPIETC